MDSSDRLPVRYEVHCDIPGLSLNVEIWPYQKYFRYRLAMWLAVSLA